MRSLTQTFWGWLRWLGMSLALLAVPRARAEPCDSGNDQRVRLQVAAELSPSLSRSVAEQLRPALADLGLGVCEGAAQGGDLSLTISLHPGAPNTFDIEVRDAITGKTLSRELDLTEVPSDGQPLALAIASDELLRASGLELTVHPADRTRLPVPTPAVERSTELAVNAGRARRAELSVAASGAAYERGELHLGADVALSYWLVPWLATEVELSLREGTAVRSQHGRTRTSLLGGGGALLLEPFRTRRAGIALVARTTLFHAVVSGSADSGAESTKGADWAVVEQFAVRGTWMGSDRVGAAFELGVGKALREVVATDDGRATSGVFGFHLSARTSVGIRF